MKNIPLLLGTILGTVVLIVVVATMFSSDGTLTKDPSELPAADMAVIMDGARHTLDTSVNAPTNIIIPDLEEETLANDEEVFVTDLSQVEATQSSGSVVEENQKIVEIVEFSDFQCPACKAALPAIELVKANYAGKVKITFRHFPLDSIHPNARLAAIASEAAASLDESTFWQYHDLLFENQAKWSNIRDRQELKDVFASYSTQLGLDRTAFLERMEDNSIADLVNQDVSAATKLGINSTPTFYVNGIKTSAPQLSATVETVLNN